MDEFYAIIEIVKDLTQVPNVDRIFLAPAFASFRYAVCEEMPVDSV